MNFAFHQHGSPGSESGVVSDCDTMADLATLLRQEIPEGRNSLTENHTNLERVAEYCEANYFQSEHKRTALEETKNYTTQSLASVAYQINTLAYNFLQLLDLQTSQLAEMESQMNHISQTVMIHREKVARREIGVLTANKSTNRQYKIIAPANPEKPIKYVRKPIDYTIYDDIGHGARNNGTPKQKQRGSSQGSIQSLNSMVGNSVGPAPTTKPPTPPQVSRAPSKVSITGTLTKNSRDYRTPPAVAPPQVPSHYAPNYPMGHPRRERGPGYSTLPLTSSQQVASPPQVGMVMPMNMQQQNMHPQTPPPPPPVSSSYIDDRHMSMPPPPSPLVNQEMVMPNKNQHHPMMMQQHAPVPAGSLGMHTLSHAHGQRLSRDSQSPPLPPPPPPEDEHASFGRPRTSTVMPIVPDEDDLPGWVPKNYIEKVIAIYDYYADKDDELSFQESAVIYVLKKNDDGWWEGVMDGITGLFPGNYVEPCV
ncbi:abl interactor 2-like [Coccinella septempunctata]|uniref:abl interactor 2-like n=1 Tax=Coccinella septempunctata TaxID=41139 RepID=UPI001D05EE1F|nr:abl interactor 2-like [Coccinella septempunctata]